MVLSFTSKIPNGNIERNFVERLKNEQVSCTIRENDLPGQKEEQKQQMKLFESFTFLCIVLAVVCNLIDYLLDGHIGWAWFVTARGVLHLADGFSGLCEAAESSEE